MCYVMCNLTDRLLLKFLTTPPPKHETLTAYQKRVTSVRELPIALYKIRSKARESQLFSYFTDCHRVDLLHFNEPSRRSIPD